MRTIQHPDVEIRETDLSQVAPAIAGTTALVAGFANRGENSEPIQFTSRNAFLNYFGQPTNEAEYYFYKAGDEILKQQGGLIASRIPYDSTSTGYFRTQTYTIGSAVDFDPSSPDISGTSLSGFVSLSAEGLSGYNEISNTGVTEMTPVSSVDEYRTGTAVTTNRMIVINKLRDTLKKTSNGDEYGGVFTAVVTPFNAFANQRLVDFVSTSDPFDGWDCLSGIGTASGTDLFPTSLSGSYSTPITNNFTKSSISKSLGAQFPTITYDERGCLDNFYMHQIMIAVCKTYEDTRNDNKIGVQILETFVGSLNSSAIDNATGESIFIDNIINNNSEYVELYSNVTTNLPDNGYMYKVSDNLAHLLSFTSAESAKNIKYSDIISSLDTIFTKTSNIDEYTIDLVVDAGVSTIAEMTTSGQIFDPSVYDSSTDNITERADVDLWRAVCNKYNEFCKFTRKDCMAVIDGPRNLVLQGNEKIERSSAPDQLVDTDIIPKLKYVSGLNTSYGAGNIMWDKMVNEFDGQPIWVPPSIKATGVMIYTDRTANYWDAPAGLNRGVLYDVSDIAFNPNGSQMDQIYTKSWNYARLYPLDGAVLEGQKTLQVKPSAFDRINVRRLFLRLERQAYEVLRYFMYEPNNYFTRNRIIDILTPTFEDVKLRGGLYDYRIVCDESNNTAEVIDRNELKIAIMLKATKTGEFILCDFYALRTDASFSEIIL